MRKAIALAVLISVIASGCSLNEDLHPEKYHVTCYQYSKVIFDDVLIRKFSGGIFYWADEETGLRVIVPKDGCVWEAVKDES